MIRSCRFLPLAALLVGAVVFGAPNQVRAAFQMRLTSSTAGTMTITDNGGGDSSAMSGVILFSGSFGAYTIQVDTGETKPVLGSAASPDMDLSYSVNRTSAGAPETLTIAISDTGFTTSPLPMLMIYGGTNGPGTTSRMIAGTGLNNAGFNTGDASGSDPSMGTFPTGSFSGDSTFTVPDNSGADYSLTLAVTLNNNGSRGISSGDAEITPAPVPAGLLLALNGIPVLGLGAWLRRRRVHTAA